MEWLNARQVVMTGYSIIHPEHAGFLSPMDDPHVREVAARVGHLLNHLLNQCVSLLTHIVYIYIYNYVLILYYITSYFFIATYSVYIYIYIYNYVSSSFYRHILLLTPKGGGARRPHAVAGAPPLSEQTNNTK